MTTATPTGLLPDAFQPLPLGAIRPTGWLLDQLRTQADGLSGHLDEFWPDVAQSGWIGGDREGWERGPYWLDGLVPLAFLLQDERLIGKVRRWVDYILDHQTHDGWLGPTYHRLPDAPAILSPNQTNRSRRRYDPWPRAIVLKALVQFHEATGDPRIEPAIARFLRRLEEIIATEPLDSWAKYRWAELLLTVHWLYRRTGEGWLLTLGDRLHEQGFDWERHFAAFPFHGRIPADQCELSGHGPNNAMAIKAPAVRHRQSRDPADLAAVDTILGELDRWHGQATGMFSCDEHLAGRSPSQGSELCAVVEYVYSLEVLVAVLGRVEHADRLERLAFNALPATISPEMWTHQYDQQVNGVECQVAEDRVYTSNGPDANLFGLEPHFGCCTANMHQGWPKFASHLWMATPDGGLAAVAWAPCVVETTVGGHDVRVEVETDYPFDERITVRVRNGGDRPVPLALRIPAWAAGPTVAVAGAPPAGVTAGTFHRLHAPAGESEIALWFGMPVGVEHRSSSAVALSSGPLLLALRMGERWERVVARETVSDWAVLGTTPWNYALEPGVLSGATVQRRPLTAGRAPFGPDAAPISVTVVARRLPGWGMAHGAAAPPPDGPVTSDQQLERIDLIPYGCTNIRVAEFPVLGDDPDHVA